MSKEETVGGKASTKWAEKMTKLSDHCYAPRYIKFFVCGFPQKAEDPDPFESVENEMGKWVNKGRQNNIGYEILQATPVITEEEVSVMALYRKFALY